MKHLTMAVIGLTITAASAHASTTIGFEDATGGGNAIGNFYLSQGLTFSNAKWYAFPDTRPGQSGNFGMLDVDHNGKPKIDSPIVGVFTSPVDMVSIQAIDVGYNDARLDVYDAQVGGNKLGSVTYQGFTALGNEGDANDTSLLQLSFAGIMRFELYQPVSNQDGSPNDGVLFDTLSFNVQETSPVPLPTALPLLLSGLGGLGFMGWRRKRAKAA